LLGYQFNMGVLKPIPRRKKKILKAAEEGDASTLGRLLSQGDTPSVTDDRGMTPLHWAAGNGGIEVAKLLVAHGAQISIKDKFLASPLHWACVAGDIEVAEQLLDHGAEFQSGDIFEATPLMKAAQYPLTLLEADETDLVTLLLNRGADMEAINYAGFSPLFYAAVAGRLNIVKHLVDAGANIHHRDRRGMTLVHVAAAYGLVEMLEYFLDLGLQVNQRSWHCDHVAPLHLAAQNNHGDIISVLVNRGADKHMEARGANAAGWAARSGHVVSPLLL
jgi:ankyrin repeat protein